MHPIETTAFKRVPLLLILSLASVATLTVLAQEQPAAQNDQPDNRPFKVKLPFPAGEQYRVSQGNFGRFSHDCDEFQYAWDFDLPEGSAVAAAAAGRVVDVKQDGKIGGGSRRFASSTNYVLIDHGHGHFSRYMHLQFEGAKVKVGELVKAGQIIALSGATGFATSAHLHFQVCDFHGTSQPALFVDFPARGGAPRTGDNCRSGAATPAIDSFEGDSPLPVDAFARNGVKLSSTLPARIFEEGEAYRIKGASAERGAKVLLFVMPMNSFDEIERFSGALERDGSFDFSVNMKLPRPDGKLACQCFRMTLVVAGSDGSFQSGVNTPIFIAEHTDTAQAKVALPTGGAAPVQLYSPIHP
jgi:murein DD-endopeptidase MepM/ murein hydrolase activator NlpD